ncbi:MAG: hypothetical protein IJA60_01080 [Clostridia bacterium]|nr:hypothetical protein [Clostridia bacterium]
MSEPNLNDILSGGGLSSILQNPDIAAKLPRIMEALGPVMAEMRAEKSADAQNEETANEASDNTTAPVATLLSGNVQRPSSARRCALLRALEPYLSDSRREAMEYIIKVSSVIDLLSEVM